MPTPNHVRRFSHRKRLLFIALYLTGLLGCESIITAPGEVLPETRNTSNLATPYDIHTVDGYAFTTNGSASSTLHPDGSLNIACETSPCAFWSDVSNRESSHIYTHPIETRPGGRFETRLDGRVVGKPTTLGSIIHETLDDGSTLIRLHLPEAMRDRVVGDYALVTFLWQGKVQYQTNRPIQPYIDLAFYNTPGQPAAKSADTSDEGPTSYYWACIEGTCGWMVDWEESGKILSDPVTLVPAFPAPFEEISVDYLRIEVKLDTEDIQGEKVRFEFNDMPGCTITHVES